MSIDDRLLYALEEWGMVEWVPPTPGRVEMAIGRLHGVLNNHGLKIVDTRDAVPTAEPDAIPGTAMGLDPADTKCPDCHYITFAGKPPCHADRCPRVKQPDPIFFPPLDADESSLWRDTYVARVSNATVATTPNLVADQAVRDYRSSVRARG